MTLDLSDFSLRSYSPKVGAGGLRDLTTHQDDLLIYKDADSKSGEAALKTLIADGVYNGENRG